MPGAVLLTPGLRSFAHGPCLHQAKSARLRPQKLPLDLALALAQDLSSSNQVAIVAPLFRPARALPLFRPSPLLPNLFSALHSLVLTKFAKHPPHQSHLLDPLLQTIIAANPPAWTTKISSITRKAGASPPMLVKLHLLLHKAWTTQMVWTAQWVSAVWLESLLRLDTSKT